MIVETPRCLILASASPRRKELLAELRYPFTVVPSGVDEDLHLADSTESTARVLAVEKAKWVGSQMTSGLVIGADTLIDLDGDILGKPADAADAVEMLRRIRGRVHRVITGVAVMDCDSKDCLSASVATKVEMREYSDDDIARYVASGEPLDKAGAYAIQGLGGELVASTSGCYNNVVGLPLCTLSDLLRRCSLPLERDRVYCSDPNGQACPASRVS